MSETSIWERNGLGKEQYMTKEPSKARETRRPGDFLLVDAISVMGPR